MAEQLQENLVDLNLSIEEDPNNTWAIAHRGETYRLMKRYEAALTDFNRAIELKPNYIWAIAHRGSTYRLMKRYEAALTDFNRAIELKPNYIWAIAYRCQVYGLMRRYEEALVDFDRAIALDETIISHWRSERGLLLGYCRRYSEAIECCEQALREKPDDYRALYSLAVAKAHRQGRVEARPQIDAARAALQSFVKTETSGAALYRLGGLAALEGCIDQALNYLERALPLEDEIIDLVNHDLVWLDLRTDPRFQSLIVESEAT